MSQATSATNGKYAPHANGAAVAKPARKAMKINIAAPAAMLNYAAEQAKRSSFADMVRPAQPAKGVIPDGEQPMAMDAVIAMDDAWSQFASTPYSGSMGMGAESLVWLGYPFLAELSQRAEYRMMSETIAKEMTRRWIELESTGEKSALGSKEDKIKRIEDLLEHHKVREKFRRAAELDGFFGRGQIYIDTGCTDQNEELLTPLLLHKAKINPRRGKLKHLKVVEPFWTYPGDYNSTNPLKPDFYIPRSWYVMGVKLHASRMLNFVSREMPDMLKPAYSFGGMSISQLAQPYVANWLRTRQSVSDLLHSFSVSGLKTNMSSTLEEANDGSDLASRAQLFNITRDNRGLLMLDKDTEDFFNVSTPLGTLDHLQAQAQEQMSSVSHIPLIILLGITPSGLNASSDGEIRVFYSWIKSMQEHLFSDPLRKLIDIIQLGEWGEIDPEISFKYVPLWEESEKDRADVKKTQADTDAVYVGLGAIGPDEVRKRIAEDPDLPYQDLDLSEPAPGEEPGFGEEGVGADPGGDPSGGPPPRLGNGLAAPGGAQPPNSNTPGQAALGQAKKAMGGGGEDSRVLPFAADADFIESEHPRDESGKFGSGAGGGGGSSGATVKPKQALPKAFQKIKINPRNTDPEAIEKTNGYIRSIPEHLLHESSAKEIRIFDNPEDASREVEKLIKKYGDDFPEDGVNGAYVRGPGILVASLWSSVDSSESGRNFYHEFAHSLEGKIQGDEWEKAWHEWSDNGQDEGFAEAFAEYMVSAKDGKEALDDYEYAHPKSYAMFQSWGIKAADQTLAQDEDSKPVHRYQFDGIRVGIETRKGEVREGRSGLWAVELLADYGYIMRTEGADGDRMDCYVGPYRPEQLAVFVIDQHKTDATGAFDEHKVMLGFQTITDAIACYDAGYPDGSGPKRRKRIWQMSWDQLKPWLSEAKRSYAMDADLCECQGCGCNKCCPPP